MLNKRIEKLTSDILQKLNVHELPIPVEEVATKLGLQIKPYDLGDEVSGLLVMDKGVGIIGFNPNEAKVRQRFTIAHELGHYEMHRKTMGLFIDKSFKVEFRNQNSSTGEIKKELEANAFAAALLMPEKLLLKEIRNHKYDLTEDSSMKELAKLFNVSVSAMTFRIANLNLFLRA